MSHLEKIIVAPLRNVIPHRFWFGTHATNANQNLDRCGPVHEALLHLGKEGCHSGDTIHTKVLGARIVVVDQRAVV
jgi:hypothetical protein